MNNITIGIPRGLLYYKNKYFIDTFFRELGINILLSDESNINNINNVDICLPLNIYLSHINNLIDKVDYILVIKDKNKCNYINYLYDIINNNKLIEYYIDDFDNNLNTFSKLLGLGKHNILNAYNIAKKEEYKQNKINYLLQEKKLLRDSKKLLIICNEYLYFDNIIKKYIIDIIKDKNIDIIYSNIYNIDENISNIDNIIRLNKYVSNTLIITTFPCVYNSIDIYNITKNINGKYLILNIDNNLNFHKDELIDFINNIGDDYE